MDFYFLINCSTSLYNGPYSDNGNAQNNKTSYVYSGVEKNDGTIDGGIAYVLSTGTNVTISAEDPNKVASIEVDSPIVMNTSALNPYKKNKQFRVASNYDDTATLTLNAQRDITINSAITAKNSSILNVILHSDTDADNLGAVVVNANINTNGGSFTAGSGKDIKDGTVGTYFGGSNALTVATKGGAINLYGNVAIGLDGKDLTLDTSNGTKGGNVTITGTVDSGNAYKAFTNVQTDGNYTEAWLSVLKLYYNDRVKAGNGYTTGWGRNTKTVAFNDLTDDQKADLSTYLGQHWELAYKYAKEGTNGAAATGDKYLATITNSLENSIVNATIGGQENELFIGGLTTDKTDVGYNGTVNSPRVFYWVTGPEGAAGTGKVTVGNTTYNGTAFYDETGRSGNQGQGYTEPNMYANWNPNYLDNNSGHVQPYVAVGYSNQSKWDDVDNNNSTVHGFVQETNLKNSGLVVKAASGTVDIQGNLGNSVALDKVEINNTGNVNVGGGKSYAGDTYTGTIKVTGTGAGEGTVAINSTGIVTIGDTINAAKAVTIGKSNSRAASASVGGKITSGTATNIYTTGNIITNGVDAGDKILLSSNGGSYDAANNVLSDDAGVITINGALTSDSTANDAVVIDTKGTFVNATKTGSAITTGKGGNWKVYSASPDRDTFGTNLNSNTSAKWAITSANYKSTEEGNRYVFAYVPTVTVKAADQSKVYGDTIAATTNEVTYTAEDFSKYKKAFDESGVKTYDGATTAKVNGAAATARRDGGYKDADGDGNKEVYKIDINQSGVTGQNGYAVKYADGDLRIDRRAVTVNADASLTYGDKDHVTETQTTIGGKGLANSDKVGTITSRT